jgi:hypothetical protein
MWILLVLQELTHHFYTEESRRAQVEGGQEDFSSVHSFWPEQYRENVSQLSDNSNQEGKDYNGRSRAILLCHHFDLICGTSTGGYVSTLADSSVAYHLQTYYNQAREVPYGCGRLYHGVRTDEKSRLRQPQNHFAEGHGGAMAQI